MQMKGAADLLLQFSLHSLLKTLQNEEVNCTLQQLEAGGVLLGMVKGGLFFVFFLVLSIQVPKLPNTADELRKRTASLSKLLAAWRPSPGAGLLGN